MNSFCRELLKLNLVKLEPKISEKTEEIGIVFIQFNIMYKAAYYIGKDPKTNPRKRKR